MVLKEYHHALRKLPFKRVLCVFLPVEGGSLVAESLLPGAESPEVLGSLGDNIRAELEKEKSLSNAGLLIRITPK